MDQFAKIKDRGNQLFKQKKFKQSIEVFQDAISKIVEKFPLQINSSTEEVGKLHVILLINASLAAINLKTQQYYMLAQQYCTKAITIDSKNVKAFYRRALAYKENAQLLEREEGTNAKELLSLYEKAKKDFENLNVIDRKNELAMQKLSQTIKDIYRVTVSQGKEVNLSNKAQQKQTVTKQFATIKKQEKVVKKTINMEQIMKDYKVDQVTLIARQKVQNAYLKEKLPQNRADLEKAIRDLQKSPNIYIKFIYRFTEQYLKSASPTFDMLLNIVTCILKLGEGEQAKNALKATRGQKSFDLMWKSFISKEKKQFRQKWVVLGNKEQDLP